VPARYRFLTLDVFTDRPYGGNPLAVLPDATGLDEAQMARIAGELNVSETVFVFPPDDPANTAKLRIWTPTVELPFAGHPTVGTAVALALEGRVPAEREIRLEERVGPVAVSVRPPDGDRPGKATMSSPRLPDAGPSTAPLEALAAVVGLRPRDLSEGALAPASTYGRVRFTFVPVTSSDAVTRARLDVNAWQRVLAHSGFPNVYLFAVDGADVHARMFAPGIGVAEDPATGAAAVALGPWLAGRLGREDGTHAWTIRQGAEMGRPGRIELAVDVVDQHATAVRVGGEAVPVTEGTLLAPPAG
jgi:trans-2,3-dihydro-3-hydroxyanthranilate isomerase